MKILFLMPASPLGDNISGAASRYLQDLKALASFGHEIHVARIDQRKRYVGLTGDAPEVDALAKSFERVEIADDPKRSKVIEAGLGALDPFAAAYPGAGLIGREVRRLIARHKPDLIWVEHTDIAAGMTAIDCTGRWIFSQTDILSRVRAIRLSAGGHRLTMWERASLDALRRAETRIFQFAPVIVTGSLTDAARIRAMGGRDVRTIPMFYEVDAPAQLEVCAAPKIIHLGSLETTANRLGLEAYLTKVHPHLPGSQLHIIGSTKALKAPLTELLQQDGVQVIGYVDDLRTAMRVGDISVLPYEHDTGYRTKLPLLMRYGQAIVTTRAAVAGSLIDGLESACVIVDRVEDFPHALLHVLTDVRERERLSKAAMAFFERHFTREAVIEMYRGLIEG